MAAKLSNKDILKANALFGVLDEGALETVKCDRGVFQKNGTVYSPADFRKALGIVVRGSVSVYRKGSCSKEVVLNTIKKGGIFGAAALFNSGSAPQDGYVTEIRAGSDTEILFVDGESVENLIRSYPDFAVGYVSYLSGRIRFLNSRITDFTGENGVKKLAGCLAKTESAPDGTVRINRAALSKKLNIGRATLYRALACLEDKGLIEKAENGYRIPDREKLRRFAGP